MKNRGVVRLDDRAMAFQSADEQAPVPVFGETRERVELLHAQAGDTEWIEQGVTQPLGELVKRHEPITGYCRMAAAITEGHAGEAHAPWPDRPEQLQQSA